MISAKKLIKLARKWQKAVALRRKGITLPQTVDATHYASSCNTWPMAEKGHFVVYSIDQIRFLIPLKYLDNEVIREMFNMAEEEFGLPSEGPLTLPCQAELMEYAVTLIKQKATRDVERALLTTIASSCCSLPFHQQHQVASHQLSIYSF